jgi:hypothetical protein
MLSFLLTFQEMLQDKNTNYINHHIKEQITKMHMYKLVAVGYLWVMSFLADFAIQSSGLRIAQCLLNH